MTTVLLVVAVLVAVLVLFVLIEVRKFRGLGEGGDLKGSLDLTKSITNDLELFRAAVERSGRELREEVTGNMRGSITELGTHIKGSLGSVQMNFGEIPHTVDGTNDSIERRLRMMSKALKEVEQLRDGDPKEGDVDFDFDDIEDDETV
jgi:hypothetical protein|tara:strand:+ start:312 stop:755 length:444 start_codon:yes stop_codon:yes gene_type:complete